MERMNISSSILGLMAQRNLAQTNRSLARAMERLASGRRVNSARDDAAGLAITNGLNAQRRGTLQAIRNMNDARGFLNTADGALDTETQIVQRMRELALQAANGTLSNDSRSYLNGEFQQLLQEFDRIADQTSFNGVPILNGSYAGSSIQVGAGKGQSISFSLANIKADHVFTVTESVTTTTIGTGTFQSRTTVATTANLAETLEAIDVNSDGYLDLVQAAAGGGSVAHIFLNNGNGTFAAEQSLTFGSNPFHVLGADFNGDGKTDLISADRNAGTVSLRLGNGDGTFQARTPTTVGSAVWRLATSDLNGDNKVDVVSANWTDGTLSVLLGNGDGTFQTCRTLAAGTQPESVAIDDFNGDGRNDLVCIEPIGQTMSIFLGNGDGTFQSRSTISIAGRIGVCVRTGDLNGDDKVDLIGVANTDGILISLGNGDGTFTAPTLMAAGPGDNNVELYDFNGDGSLDLAAGDSAQHSVSVWLGNGNGTFQTRRTYLAAGVPQIALGDFDHDGVTDIASTDQGSTTVSIFIGNSTQGGTTDITTPATLSIATQSDAEDVLEYIDTGLTYLNEARASIGAVQNRIEYAASNALTLVENISKAQSEMMDADMASETAELLRLNILQQAGVSVLTQANFNTQLSLKLLENL